LSYYNIQQFYISINIKIVTICNILIFISGMKYLATIILTTGISITMIGGMVLLLYIAWKTLND